MAIQFWHNQGISNKRKVIALNGAYHGDTFGAMAIGERGAFTAPFASYLFDVRYIDFPTTGNEQDILEQFRDILKDSDIGTFIFEPLVQAAAGMRMYPARVLDKLIQAAHNHDVICIADEVFTGFGRTGKMFASDYLNNKPDIIAVSKGITGGALPLGATSCSDRIVSAFISSDRQKTFFHGHSYTANPIACAAANASFELLIDNTCQEQIEMIETHHKDFSQRIASHRHVLNARSLGTILAIELKTPEGTSYFNEIRKWSYKFFLDRNILLRPLGNVIYVLPPYVIKEDELKIIYSCIAEFLDSLQF
jgi:adenosylmethionine-8-amino-7-oxononanoate aminotransferase